MPRACTQQLQSCTETLPYIAANPMLVMQVGMTPIGTLTLLLLLVSSALVNKARSRDSRGRRA